MYCGDKLIDCHLYKIWQRKQTVSLIHVLSTCICWYVHTDADAGSVPARRGGRGDRPQVLVGHFAELAHVGERQEHPASS